MTMNLLQLSKIIQRGKILHVAPLQIRVVSLILQGPTGPEEGTGFIS